MANKKQEIAAESGILCFALRVESLRITYSSYFPFIMNQVNFENPYGEACEQQKVQTSLHICAVCYAHICYLFSDKCNI